MAKSGKSSQSIRLEDLKSVIQQLDGYVANTREQYRELVNSGAMDRMIEEEEDGR